MKSMQQIFRECENNGFAEKKILVSINSDESLDEGKFTDFIGLTELIELEIFVNDKKLSKREIECAYYLIRGMTAKQIAKIIFLSPRTIEHYIDRIKSKFKCKSRSDLIMSILNTKVFL